MHLGAVLLAARSVPRALALTGLVTGVLFGLSGGLATAAAVMAADVESAYDRLTSATDGFDAAMFTEGSVDALVAELREVDGVADVATGAFFEVAAVTNGASPMALGPQPDDPCYTGAGDVNATQDTDGWRGRSPQLALAQGRSPRAEAREVVLPTVTARRLGLGVGDRIVFTGDCSRDGNEFDHPIEVRVSGLGTSVLDGPAVGANLSLETLLISERLAEELIDLGTEPGPYTMVWLDDGVRPSELRGLPGGAEIPLDLVELRDAVRADLRPDATALRVFAAIVALSALVILSPMLGRLMRASNDDAPTLRALGMSRRGLVAIGAVRGTAVGLVTAIVTAAATIGLGARIPLGAARQFAGAIPFSAGAVRAVVGALIVGAVAVAVTGVIASVSVRRHGSTHTPARDGRGRRISSALALPPDWAAGVRFALHPGSLDDPTPVRSGLITAGLAVAAVVGVITFSSSLDHLRQTPRLYGLNWDVFTLTGDADALATTLEADPEVTSLSRGTFFPPQSSTLGDDGAEVWLMSFEAGPGRARPTVISGRAPEADHEVMLARALSETTGAGIGDTVDLHLPTKESALAASLQVPWDGPTERITEFHVVGIGVLPIGDGRIGIGASVTFEGLKSALGPATSPGLLRIVAGASPEMLASALQGNAVRAVTTADIAAMSDEEVLTRLVEPHAPQLVVLDAGGRERAIRKVIAASGGSLSKADFADEPTPERVVNLDLSQASRIPDVFSGLMAAVAMTVVSVLVTIGGRQRRQELATLRALGFDDRHVRRALAVQALTTVLAACVLAPVGVALGRLTWLSYATGLGVAPEASVSTLHIAGALVSLLVTALAVALVAARFHGGRALAPMLRPRE